MSGRNGLVDELWRQQSIWSQTASRGCVGPTRATLNDFAGSLCDLGESVTARPLFERALHIREAAYGPDHPEVALTLGSLAIALRDLGESATARPLLQRALHIAETAYGPDHPASLRVRQALRQLGDTSE
jgi:Tfp pilus assembly protein PilF